MLGVSERTFRRWRDRLRDEGPEGLRDRRIGKPSSRRAAVAEILRMLGLYQERYEGFTVKHFHEQLQKRHHYKLGYTVTRLALQGAGLVRPAPRRSAHRKKRPRRPMVGMMLHQDASRFAWLPGDDRQYDLVVTLDDATSAVYSGFIVEEEGTVSSFRALAEVIDQHGLFCELYTDRGSHYFHTPKAGEAVSRRGKRRSGAPWRSSASATSRPIRPRRAAAASAPSAPCRTGRRRSWRWPASRRSQRPIAGSPRAIGRPTMPPSRSPRPRPVAPSSAIAAAECRTFCASRRSAGWGTIIPSSGEA
jgi:transposase